MQTALQWESYTVIALPAYTVFLKSEPALKKGYWNYISASKTEPFYIQSYSYVTISIFTNQSKQLHSEHRWHKILSCKKKKEDHKYQFVKNITLRT